LSGKAGWRCERPIGLKRCTTQALRPLVNSFPIEREGGEKGKSYSAEAEDLGLGDKLFPRKQDGAALFEIRCKSKGDPNESVWPPPEGRKKKGRLTPWTGSVRKTEKGGPTESEGKRFWVIRGAGGREKEKTKKILQVENQGNDGILISLGALQRGVPTRGQGSIRNYKKRRGSWQEQMMRVGGGINGHLLEPGGRS